MICVLFSQVAKREYRGQRSLEAIVQFVKEQLRDPVQQIAEYTAVNLPVSVI